MRLTATVFYSYAYEDRILRGKLEKHLAAMKHQGLITDWHDRNINTDTTWRQEIDRNLNEADIILLLVSPDFMHSKYHYGIEMERALERYENGTARVVPILMRPVDWEDTPFSKLQMLPIDRKPITKWSNRDEAFHHVAEEIKRVVKEVLKENYLYEGDIYYGREQYDEALDAFEQALRLDPTCVVALTKKGLSQLELSMNDQALEVFEQAIYLDPTNAIACNGKADAIFGETLVIGMKVL